MYILKVISNFGFVAFEWHQVWLVFRSIMYNLGRIEETVNSLHVFWLCNHRIASDFKKQYTTNNEWTNIYITSCPNAISFVVK